MCGIFFYSGKYLKNKNLNEEFNKIRHRGPDNSTNIIISMKDNDLYLGFHRLSINGLNNESNQPLVDDNVYLI